MKTLSYILGTEREIEINETYYFGQLWPGDGDGLEILNDGCVSPDNENIVAFDILTEDADILNYIVRVTDIY